MNIFNLLVAMFETTSQDPKTPPETPWGTYIIMGVLLIAIIGLFIWQNISNKKKQQQAQEVINNLKIGDRVKTIGGICGFVAQINDSENTFVLETGLEENKSYIKFDKGAIYQTAPAQGNAVEKPAQPAKPAEKAVEKQEVAQEEQQEKPKRTRKKKAQTEEN